MRRSSRIVGVAAAVAAAAVMSIQPAAATPPRAGAIYKGHVANRGTSPPVVKFKVSKSGAWVKNMYVGPYPLNTCGSGGSPPSQSSDPARIKNGKFTAHIAYRGGGKVIAKATVSGTFLRHGKEKGVVIGTLVGMPQCRGSFDYTTRAQ